MKKIQGRFLGFSTINGNRIPHKWTAEADFGEPRFGTAANLFQTFILKYTAAPLPILNYNEAIVYSKPKLNFRLGNTLMRITIQGSCSIGIRGIGWILVSMFNDPARYANLSSFPGVFSWEGSLTLEI